MVWIHAAGARSMTCCCGSRGNARSGVLLCTHLLDDVERLCNRIGIIDRGRTVAEGPLTDLIAQGQDGQRYRLRMTAVPDLNKALPHGLVMVNREDEWWHLAVEPAAMSRLPALWGELMAQGFGFTEIQPEGDGLERSFLQLTTPLDGHLGERAA